MPRGVSHPNRRTFLTIAGLGTLSLAGKGLQAALPVERTEAAPVPNEIPTVDAHVHVWTRDPRYPFAPGTRTPAPPEATAETLLALMAANGVAHTVIIQVIHYRWDNRYVAAVLKRYPGKFHGVARVDPQDPRAPDALSRLTEEQGFHGVRLSPAADASGDWIRGPLMPPLWRRCQELRVPMTLLTPVARLPDIARLAEQFPELTIVIDHMADSPPQDPSQLDTLLALRRHPSLYVKISHAWSLSREPYPYRDVHAQIRRLYDAFGPQRLIACTDWPISSARCSYAQAIDFARTQLPFLSAEDKRWICGQTARQVWPFPAA